jgi:LysR family transcriptional regulator, glycine cleavage system transcriptional activator
MQGETRFPTWATWLRENGVTDVDASRGARINDSAAVLQAAIAGAGVALGRTTLVAGDLAAGRLVRPFGEALLPELAYYVIEAEEEVRLPGVMDLVAWLHAEATESASGPTGY